MDLAKIPKPVLIGGGVIVAILIFVLMGKLGNSGGNNVNVGAGGSKTNSGSSGSSDSSGSSTDPTIKDLETQLAAAQKALTDAINNNTASNSADVTSLQQEIAALQKQITDGLNKPNLPTLKFWDSGYFHSFSQALSGAGFYAFLDSSNHLSDSQIMQAQSNWIATLQKFDPGFAALNQQQLQTLFNHIYRSGAGNTVNPQFDPKYVANAEGAIADYINSQIALWKTQGLINTSGIASNSGTGGVGTMPATGKDVGGTGPGGVAG